GTWRTTMPRAAAASILAVAAGVAIATRGVTATDLQQPTFRVGVDLVSLTVTVTDHAEKFVGGLTAPDFAVTEDGVPQPVSFFMSDHVPLDLAIVLDTSGSMGAELRLVQDAACGLARALHPGDRGSV